MAKVSRSVLKDLVKECLVEILAEGLASSSETIMEAKASRRTRKKQPNRVTPEEFQQRNKMLRERTSKKIPEPPAAISELTTDPMMQEIFADTAKTTLQEQKAGEGKAKVYTPVDAISKVAYENKPEDLFDGSQNWAALAFSDGKK